MATPNIESEKYEVRKITVEGSNALIIFKGNETVLYIKPYSLETSKTVDLIDLITNFLNRKNDNN